MRFWQGLVIGLVWRHQPYLLLLAVKKPLPGKPPAIAAISCAICDFAVRLCLPLFRDPLAIGGTLLGLLTVLVVGLWLYPSGRGQIWMMDELPVRGKRHTGFDFCYPGIGLEVTSVVTNVGDYGH